MDYSITVQSGPGGNACQATGWAIFLDWRSRVTPAEHEDMTLKHDQILNGVDGQKAIVEKVEDLYEWFLTSRGKNTVIMFIKDLLISGGIRAIFISYLISK